MRCTLRDTVWNFPGTGDSITILSLLISPGAMFFIIKLLGDESRHRSNDYISSSWPLFILCLRIYTIHVP